MFALMVVLVMFVFPTVSILMELFVFKTGAGILPLVGKWLVFWGVGVRLFSAGIRQALCPQFTAKEIFEITDTKPMVIVRELGFGNISIGFLGLATQLNSLWIIPSAVSGCLFYGLVTFQHLIRKGKNRHESFVTTSDLLMFIILVVWIAGTEWKV